VPNRDPLKPPPEPPTQPDARTLAGRRERCTEAHACCRNGSDVRLDGQQTWWPILRATPGGSEAQRGSRSTSRRCA
jgi:hypothetical protein